MSCEDPRVIWQAHQFAKTLSHHSWVSLRQICASYIAIEKNVAAYQKPVLPTVETDMPASMSWCVYDLQCNTKLAMSLMSKQRQLNPPKLTPQNTRTHNSPTRTRRDTQSHKEQTASQCIHVRQNYHEKQNA